MASIFDVIQANKVQQNQQATGATDLVPLAQVETILNSLFTGAWNNSANYTAGQSATDGGSLYIANADNTNKQPSLNTPSIWRLAAAAGTSSFTYIAYADDASGTGFTNTFNSSKAYIAILVSNTFIGSPNAGNFSGLWKNYQGATGATGSTGATGANGSNGASAYVYIAYASDNIGTGFTTTFNASLNFVAIKTTTSPIASPSVSDFTGLWKQYGTPALAANAPITFNGVNIGINATASATANYVVQRDSSGNFATNAITLSPTNSTTHLTMAGQTIGFNVDAFYFSQPISVPTKIKIGTSHELRNTSSEVQLFSNGASANVFQTSGNKLVVAVLQLTGLTAVLKADGSGNVAGSATTSDLPEGSNLYYTTGRGATAASTAITALSGVANGLATLDSGGKLASAQIPSSLVGSVNFQGTWNANTNTPSLVSSTGTKGFYYLVSVAGSTNLDGITDWQIGDWAIFDGTHWDKVDNTDAVISVNGLTGAVTMTTSNISEGSNLYFTNARVIAATLTGFTAGAGTITASDTVLGGFQKAQFRLAAIEAWTTSNVSEGSNLYFTNARAIAATLTGFSAAGGTISSSDSVLSGFQKAEFRLNAIETGANLFVIAPAASTSGSPQLLTVTGPAHTGLAATVESPDVWLNLARIVQFSTGAITNQRAVKIDAPKYAFVASSTLSFASTVAISGAPIAWSNATITNAAALRIYAGAVASANTNAYGLYVDAPTSATNNYCAAFVSGNVGIGTTAPGNLLDINGSFISLRTPHTPANSSEAGPIGQIAWDTGFIYVWTAANTVKRATLSTF